MSLDRGNQQVATGEESAAPLNNPLLIHHY
jgi:hypothetical protein